MIYRRMLSMAAVLLVCRFLFAETAVPTFIQTDPVKENRQKDPTSVKVKFVIVSDANLDAYEKQGLKLPQMGDGTVFDEEQVKKLIEFTNSDRGCSVGSVPDIELAADDKGELRLSKEYLAVLEMKMSSPDLGSGDRVDLHLSFSKDNTGKEINPPLDGSIPAGKTWVLHLKRLCEARQLSLSEDWTQIFGKRKTVAEYQEGYYLLTPTQVRTDPPN